MVNTRVKNRTHRAINRKLDRQKKALMHQNFRALANPLDDKVDSRVAVHRLKIEVLKGERERLLSSNKKQDNMMVRE